MHQRSHDWPISTAGMILCLHVGALFLLFGAIALFNGIWFAAVLLFLLGAGFISPFIISVWEMTDRLYQEAEE